MTEVQEFYYLDGARNQQGPVPAAEIVRLVRNGTVRRDTLIWYAGMPDWRAAGDIDEFASLLAQPPAPPRGASPMRPSAPGAAPYPERAPPAGAYRAEGRPSRAQPETDRRASLGFGGAIAAGFRKYADFKGRARRPDYWFWILFHWLVLMGLAIVDVEVLGARGHGSVLTGLGVLALFLPTLAVAVRRLHDTDRSGWMLLIGFIPLIGSIILLVFFCQRGTPGPNRFGPEDDLAVAEVFT